MKKSNQNIKTIVFTIISLILVHVTTAQIQGIVTDEKGKLIPGALVIAIDSTRNIRDTAVADKGGFYEFYRLSPGQYLIDVKANGFKEKMIRDIVVNPGDTGRKKNDDRYRGQRLNIILISVKS